jgi:hypothetical protein
MGPRRSKQAAERDRAVAQAVLDVQSGKYKSSYEAEKLLGLPKSSVTRRVKGGLTRSQARHSQQLLSPTQENELLRWIKRLTISGYAPSRLVLRQIVEEICPRLLRENSDASLQASSSIPPPTQLGEQWVSRFLERHPHLKAVIGRRIDSVRMNGATKPVLEAWFEAYMKIIADLGILEQDTYNMDEHGNSIGTMESTRIIIDSTCRTKHQVHPGRQEWVSIIECICADGTILPPLVIFKGQHVLHGWIPQEVRSKWYFSANTKGWTSNIHGLEWLKRVFDPSTRVKAEGKPRLLICDGHDSHISGSFIAHCVQNGITLLVLPPHTSHILQPLDIAVFGPLKKRLTAALEHFNHAQLGRIQKIEWMDAYITARREACTQENIASAWRGAGLIPFRPERAFQSIAKDPSPHPEQPITSSEHAVLDRVWMNSSPPEPSTLRRANNLLRTSLGSGTSLDSPLRRYVTKLADGAEQLTTRHIINKSETNKLRSIIQLRKRRSKGKRVLLRGHFHVSTAELRDAVIQAELDTRKKSKQSDNKKRKNALNDTESDEEVAEDMDEEFDTDIEDCIVVDVD